MMKPFRRPCPLVCGVICSWSCQLGETFLGSQNRHVRPVAPFWLLWEYSDNEINRGIWKTQRWHRLSRKGIQHFLFCLNDFSFSQINVLMTAIEKSELSEECQILQWFLTDEFIETTWLACLTFPIPRLIQGASSFFLWTSRKRKERRLENKDAIFLFATQNIENRYID
jgi:hypothetical protein